MGNTVISPRLQVSPRLQHRLKKATWWQRRKFNWAFAGYNKVYNRRARLVKHLDCGYAMADHVTGGKVSLADKEVDASRAKLAAIIDTLPEIDP